MTQMLQKYVLLIIFITPVGTMSYTILHGELDV